MGDSSLHTRLQGNTLLVFGSQEDILNPLVVNLLRASLATGPSWIRLAIGTLPFYWDMLAEKAPETAEAVDGRTWIQKLMQWLLHGLDADADVSEVPNVILTPLAVLLHFAQYWRYLHLSTDTPSEATTKTDRQATWLAQNGPDAPYQMVSIGAGVGLLSACAVASARDDHELRQNISAALRLAMLVGARADADAARDGRSRLYRLTWDAENDAIRGEIDRILAGASGGYLTSEDDKGGATLAVQDTAAGELLPQLHGANISLTELGVSGRPHTDSEENRRTAAVIQDLYDTIPGLRLPDAAVASRVPIPVYSTERITTGRLHELAIRNLLLQPGGWYRTFTQAQQAIPGEDTTVVAFGAKASIPSSTLPTIGRHLIRMVEIRPPLPPSLMPAAALPPRETDIAIVGMAVKVAGADDIDEFAQILQTGQSQHQPVPPERIQMDDSRAWYGNFARDVDAFDHRFFRRSPRESANLDPQQRLFLQTAYQAVEQSGYFSEKKGPNGTLATDIGVFVGVVTNDYEAHLQSQPANPFTATSTTSYIPTRVAHFFGWTGPTAVIDTTCSSSAVAVHSACRSILTNECRAAVAGGVNVMTRPDPFVGLSAATFLSPTGPCSPFSEGADGYCRGEGSACVVLKRMSDAIADGNQILGRIASSGVNQNMNITPHFVPNTPSLASLFRTVLLKADIPPSDISLVEAHGTGTTVGDAAEYDSVRRALAGPQRAQPLVLGSVKGHVGHTEASAGAVALIKVLTMMQLDFIPPQASFTRFPEHIHRTPDDQIEVCQALRPWSAPRNALLNSYGATGSNASMVLTQPVQYPQSTPVEENALLPFWIPGRDAQAIQAYAGRLTSYLQSHPTVALADVSFNLSRQSNRTLPESLVFSCRSKNDLLAKLSALDSSKHIQAVKEPNPVIICFGGQIARHIGLDRRIYGTVKLLRTHLDECDEAIRSLGLGTLYPDIFSSTPTEDPVKLQLMLFALQYASAKCWIDSGVTVDAVVGHSFGEITALCVSGVLSLPHTVLLVARRAGLIQRAWGDDSGAMLAVSAELAVVTQALASANERCGENAVAIACYNGPTSFTLSGSTEAIDVVAEVLAADFPGTDKKRLEVTNAFHSSLVDPLTDRLDEIGKGLKFRESVIPLERATKTAAGAVSEWSGRFISSHMREPVYFHQAVQRLADRFPSAVWLEAGSASTVTHMARLALADEAAGHTFHGLNLTNGRGCDGLTDTTVSLWRAGLPATYWAHHRNQTPDFALLFLPPYQFDKSRHWVELKPRPSIPQPQDKAQPEPKVEAIPARLRDLVTFAGFEDPGNGPVAFGPLLKFRINTHSPLYTELVHGHVLNQTAPICPASLQMAMSVEALASVHPHWDGDKLQPLALNLINHRPVCIDPTRDFWFEFTPLDGTHRAWDWKLVSTAATPESGSRALHAEAQLQMHFRADEGYKAEFTRLAETVPYRQYQSVLSLGSISDENEDVHIVRGATVYQAFSDAVEYGCNYRLLRQVVGHDGLAMGTVRKAQGPDPECWVDVPLADAFAQVAGLAINCMTGRGDGDLYTAAGCERWVRSPFVTGPSEVWHVLARHQAVSERVYKADMFVYDTAGVLVEALLGARYERFPKEALRQIITRFTTDTTVIRGKTVEVSSGPASGDIKRETGVTHSGEGKRDVLQELRVLVAELLGMEIAEIGANASLADIGIDSLMSLELGGEIQRVFDCEPDHAELADAVTVRDLSNCIYRTLYDDDAPDGECGDEDDTTDSGSDGASTPATPLSTSPEPQEQLAQSDVLDSFGAIKKLGDQRLTERGIGGYRTEAMNATDRLIVALVVEACEGLGIPLRTTTAGESLQSIDGTHIPPRYLEFLTEVLQTTASLISVDQSGLWTRTESPVAAESSEDVLQELKREYPLQDVISDLSYYAGKNLQAIIRGETNGLLILFNEAEGKRLLTAFYHDFPLTCIHAAMLRDTIQTLGARIAKQQASSGTSWPLRIMEMGGGTGGTTRILLPMLAALDIPIEYTFTDISSSMVAAARRELGKQHSFMRFAMHDIEKAPAEALHGQHLILAGNAVHATRNLAVSLGNIRQALRPDGFLMLLESTVPYGWLDLIFGLLDSWWLFEDGRTHTVVSAEHWEREMHAVGFGHVDWTEGEVAENEDHKIIVAMASGEVHARLPASG